MHRHELTASTELPDGQVNALVAPATESKRKLAICYRLFQHLIPSIKIILR